MDIGKFEAQFLVGSYLAEQADMPVTPIIPLDTLTETAAIGACRNLVSEGLLVETAIFPELFAPGKLKDLSFPSISIEGEVHLTDKGRKIVEERIFSWWKLGLININVGTHTTIVQGDINNSVTINTDTFTGMVANAINKQPVPDEKKADALSKLNEFVSHPLLNTVLGAVLGGLAAKL